MRVLMLGWDFSPRLSGGVGTACRGLAQALTRAEGALRTEVLFVLPRLRGDEAPGRVRVLGTDPLELPAAPRAAEEPGPPAPPAPPRAAGPPAREPEPGTLPSPDEALRLLTIDSPLRPYLGPSDYATAVHKLFTRLAAAPRRRASPPPATAPLAAPHATARTAMARAPLTLPLVPVPPYGKTLLAEVERYARAVLALTQAEPFDVIHAHDWMTMPAGMLLRERSGKPLVAHFHSCEAERRGAHGAREARAIEQAAIDAAERVLCVSEASARTLRANYALEYAKLRVLHDALEPVGTPAARRARATRTVLYLGRLSEQKGPDVFLRAAARVAERRPEARFVLAGEGELYPELEALARELGIRARVRFTGFVGPEELAATYGAADVYVLSSHSEPFGISALEALSLGVPTIVPKGAGVAEVVRSVLLFEPGDEADLAERMESLLVRPALAAELSSAGLREVAGLRWDRPARLLRGIYAEVAQVPA
ncbi:MAG TPA: glycosyltransferase family 4 protein [Planctomycetota bacterium]